MIPGKLLVLGAICLFFIVPLSAVAGNNSGAAFSTWPDTGQTTCYDAAGHVLNPCPTEGEAFHGQDAQYPGPARSYTSLDGGTMVRDNVTGLVWEVKQAQDGIADYSNPHDADNEYTWCDTDPNTNGGDQGTCGTNDTEDFLDALKSVDFGGSSDWRLPTLKELVTLHDYSRIDPSINPSFFPESGSFCYWSSTTYAGNPSLAWRACFYICGEGNWGKSTRNSVRAVRGGQ